MSGGTCYHGCITEQPDLGQPVTFSGLVLKATLPSSKVRSAAFSAGSRWRYGFQCEGMLLKALQQSRDSFVAKAISTLSATRSTSSR